MIYVYIHNNTPMSHPVIKIKQWQVCATVWRGKLFWLISLWVRFIFVTSLYPGTPFHLIVSLTRYTFQATFCGLHINNPLANQISSSSEVSVKALVVSLVVFFPHSPTWIFAHFSCFILYATISIKSVHMLVPSCLVFRQCRAFHKSLSQGP